MSQPKTMSPSQIAASQANGRHSKGPVTEEGRENSRFSRLRHGFYIPSFEEGMAVLGEDEADFKRLEADLIAYWRPAGAFRERLVRRLARTLWRLERVDKAESGETVRQLEALEAGCDSQARQVDAQVGPVVADLERLLDRVRRRDFGDGQQIMFALNSLRQRRKSGRLELVHELLFEPQDDLADSDDETPAEAAGEGGPPDADEAADVDRSCTEAEILLRAELQEVLARAESLKRQAVVSPAEWSARLAPQSPFLIRWQDSLGRQAERLFNLLSRLEAQDELRAGGPKPAQDGTEPGAPAEAEK